MLMLKQEVRELYKKLEKELINKVRSMNKSIKKDKVVSRKNSL